MKIAALLAAALLPTAALAQPAPTVVAPTGAAPGVRDGGRPLAGAAADAPGMTERRRARLEAIRTALNLRPDQEPAFRAYLQALRPDPAMRERMLADRERMAAMTPEQRQQAWSAASPEREAMQSRRREATRQFMAALTPEQQSALLALRRDRRGPAQRGLDAAPQPGSGGPPPADPIG